GPCGRGRGGRPAGGSHDASQRHHRAGLAQSARHNGARPLQRASLPPCPPRAGSSGRARGPAAGVRAGSVTDARPRPRPETTIRAVHAISSPRGSRLLFPFGSPRTGRAKGIWKHRRRLFIFPITKERRPIDQSMDQTMDQSTRTELEAAVYRRLVEHLRTRTDVQNIEMMNLAGFCRNCLSNWMKDAADAKGVPMTKEESREIVYGMPYDQWRAKYQKEASAEKKAAFEKASQKH